MSLCPRNNCSDTLPRLQDTGIHRKISEGVTESCEETDEIITKPRP